MGIADGAEAVASRPSSRVDRWLRSRDAWASARGRQVSLAVSAVVFVGASFLGFANLPPLDKGIRWLPIVIMVATAVPATIALNAIEYSASARLVGHRAGFADALRVAVLSTAANMLPIPGALVVRTRALRRLGPSYGRALSATALVGVAWVGVTAVAAGVLQMTAGEFTTGGPALVTGVIVVGAFVAATRSQRAHGGRYVIVRILLIELAAVALGALRYLLVLNGLGYQPSVSQAVALTVAAVLAAATGFFPGGLGLREVLVAGISPLVGLPAAVGVVATAVDRIAGLSVLAIAAVAITRLPNVPRADGDA